jgi:5-methylcytosine-specific restriction protein A
MTRPKIETDGRDVLEWIGARPDSVPPDWVKLRILRRHNGRCYLSGTEIRAGDDWQLEHIKPLHLKGENREKNLAPALAEPHREKTTREHKARAKADRIARKHLGLWPEPARKLQGRGFAPGRNRSSAEGRS